MKAEEKRTPRSYKARQSAYVKAFKRAKRERTTLSNLIEDWVVHYSYGNDVEMVLYKTKKY